MYELDNIKHQKKMLDIIKKNKDKSKFNYWNKTRDDLNKAFKQSDNKETWRTRYRNLGEEYKMTKEKSSHSYEHNHDKEARLIDYLAKRDTTVEFLSGMLDLSEIEVLGYIQKLQMSGYEILTTGDTFKLQNKLLPTNKVYELFEGEVEDVEICVVSDTHMCNKHQQLTLLNKVYDECVARGITKVLHCGDITDGQSTRPEHLYELFAFGADEQADYVIKNYPQREGITTYFLTGNHDGWLFKAGGVDVGKIIARQRPDMIYLGNQKATMMIGQCRVDLFHPMDGSAYAKSYSGQKTIENMQGGDKPNIMFVGHHHKAVYFVDRNVHYCEVPCLCAPTNFIEGKRLCNTVGALFPKIKIDDVGNVITFTPEMMIFYKMVENDYTMPDRKTYKQIVKI